MGDNFDVVIERDSEGYYVASVPALPGCHTQAQSLNEVFARIKEAIELYLEVIPTALPIRDRLSQFIRRSRPPGSGVQRLDARSMAWLD
jgi:predicted RNase H-like HicB family nuclease